MNPIRLTPKNVFQYIGCEILFKTRKNHVVTRINNTSHTGKTIHIRHPDIKDKLQILSRKIYVIL